MSTTSSNGPNFGSGPTSSQVAKPMTQAAIRMKALSQLRQVLRASPSRVGIAYSVGKDLLILLRYLPASLMNRMQHFNSSPDLYSATPEPPSSSNSATTSTHPPPASAPPSPVKKSQDKKDESKSEGRFKFLSMSLPSTPTKAKGDQSVLKNVLQMKTINNLVIINDAGVSTQATPKVLDEPSAEALVPEKIAKGKLSQLSPENDAGDGDRDPINVEDTRTRFLVSSLGKSLTSPSGSKHNLTQCLDDLFSHLYQHGYSRQSAVDAGAIKIVNKIIRKYSDNSYLVGKGREVIALLGVPPPTKGSGIKILSIDGGGVRGLAAVEVLRALERLTNQKVHEMFDYICGVSTGAILAFLLGAHRHSLDAAEAMYKDLSREIFSQSSLWGSATMVWNHAYYHTPTFEKILKKHCGEVPLISLSREPDAPRVSAISTIVNQERVVPHVFRTYEFKPGTKSKYAGGCRYHMWEAVRASAAAPTYFEEFKLGNFLHQDGGIIVNNPTAVAIGEAKTLWADTPIQCVVSIGTGITLSSRTSSTAGTGQEDVFEKAESGEKYLSWKGKFLKVLDSATDTESVHNTLNELLEPDVYFRFNPYVKEVVRLDETDPAILERVQAETRKYLERNIMKVQYVAEVLSKQKGLSKKVADWWNN